MKIFIATDIHGSAYWARKTAEKFAQSKADIMVLLGDVYNHGPRNPFPDEYSPMSVADTFNALSSSIIAVRGNCDSQVDEMISRFPFVGDNVIPLGDGRLYFTHGHVFNKDNLPPLADGDVMFYGHFHVSEIVKVDGVICVNVGSASLPKDGKHVYCIADGESVTIYDLVSDETVARVFR